MDTERDTIVAAKAARKPHADRAMDNGAGKPERGNAVERQTVPGRSKRWKQKDGVLGPIAGHQDNSFTARWGRVAMWES